jgi:pimeloyl-ACP methyl ester carboxylesterase
VNDRDFEVSFRRESRGGALSRRPRASLDAIAARSRVVLLVHGFNVSEDVANQCFTTLADSLVQIAPRLSGEIGYVHWPGDNTWGIDPLRSYQKRVHTAIACAPLLIQFIERCEDAAHAPSEIVLIAHSLGARVVVETLLILLHAKTQRTIRIVLMAAAYPEVLTKQPTVAAGLALATSLVLFSPADFILSATFPTGERWAGVSGKGPLEAVGLFGKPVEDVWSKRLRMKGYGHGDYWTHPRAHAVICRWLGFSVAVPPSESALVSRPAAERDTASRDAASRSTTTRGR